MNNSRRKNANRTQVSFDSTVGAVVKDFCSLCRGFDPRTEQIGMCNAFG